MKKLSRLSTEQRSNLVAYLDGELPDKDATAIEQVLATSPVARAEVESLSQSWKLLDYLPTYQASEDFTARTISQIQVDGTSVPLEDRPWFHHARRGLVCICWVVGLAVVGSIGFLTTNRWISDPSRELIEELPIVQHIDEYSELGSLEFLEELKNSQLFNENQTQK